jgi:hypothetical protein
MMAPPRLARHSPKGEGGRTGHARAAQAADDLGEFYREVLANAPEHGMAQHNVL